MPCRLTYTRAVYNPEQWSLTVYLQGFQTNSVDDLIKCPYIKWHKVYFNVLMLLLWLIVRVVLGNEHT